MSDIVFILTGLGIRYCFSSKSLVFCDRKSERAIRSWKRTNHSCCSFLKINGINSINVALKRATFAICLLCWQKRGKTVKDIWKICFFSLTNCSFFESDSLESRATHWGCSFLKKSRGIRSWLLFCKARWERFAHSCSFLKSKSLTVALF